jgi:hypothetical protein
MKYYDKLSYYRIILPYHIKLSYYLRTNYLRIFVNLGKLHIFARSLGILHSFAYFGKFNNIT